MQNRSVILMTFIACAVSIINGCACLPSTKYTGQTVALVELPRYMGKWYAISSLPAWFQKNCYCVTAKYSLEKDHVKVVNACRKRAPDGPLKVSTAKAFVVPHTGNSQLKVQFFWPFKGDYWIIALDDDYRYAMVGHPCKKYLWILSRKPAMDEKTYDMLVETARSKGYDVEKLERIPQQGCPPPVDH
jgi:apolipoprotein D and lipocalin family protein